METVCDARLQDLRERQASRLASETETVCDTRLQELRERQASRLAAEKETVRDARLKDMRERKSSLEASLTGEQILGSKRYRDKLYSDRLTSRISLNFARSQLPVMFQKVILMNIHVAVSHIAALYVWKILGGGEALE